MLIMFAGDTLVCTLGDPKGENVTVPGVSQRQVRAEEAKAKSAQKLALHLMDVFLYKRSDGYFPLYKVGGQGSARSRYC